MFKKILFAFALILVPLAVYILSRPSVGDVVDEFNGVKVFYNGTVAFKSHGRNLSSDGYNLGKKYQCVEFVKRYYYELYGHKMPNSYGNAIDFYDKTLSDGDVNSARGMLQFTNPSVSTPKVGDLLLFDKTLSNRYGHVAIITKVDNETVEIIQQNTFSSRDTLGLFYQNDKWLIGGGRVLGWLRFNTVE